jgi:hypothetical protein
LSRRKECSEDISIVLGISSCVINGNLPAGRQDGKVEKWEVKEKQAPAQDDENKCVSTGL